MQKTQKKASKKRLANKKKEEPKLAQESEEENLNKQNILMSQSRIQEDLDLLEKQYEDSQNKLNNYKLLNPHEIERIRTLFEIATLQLGETYHPKVVSCRDQQKLRIQQFIKEGIATKGMRETMYLSGVPGIGKTLCVNEVVSKMLAAYKGKADIQAIFVNAMNLKKQKDIFKILWEKLSGSSKGSMKALYHLNQFFYKGNQEGKRPSTSSTKIIVIDEIDYLYTKDQEVIYNILEWTQQKNSKIILIAISNTIDFPETLSSKVASRMGRCRIIFKPYSSKQIETILKERVSDTDVFQEQAVEYICKRIAKCSSDIRKCLFVLRESITTYVNQCSKTGIQKRKVSVQILIKVHTDSISDLLVNNFTYFHPMHKIVLIILAKYFRFENTACAYTELHIRCKKHIRGGQFTLKPVIIDLRENGFISFRNTTIRTDKRINKGVKLMRQYEEEHISLLLPVDSILYAACQDQKNMISIDD